VKHGMPRPDQGCRILMFSYTNVHAIRPSLF
jgi:hypothetical protein